MVGETRMLNEALNCIRDMSKGDTILMKLSSVVREGWPMNKDNVPFDLLPIFSIHRDEIRITFF
jgi:hypothetical protein